MTSNGPWALVFQLGLVGELHVSHRGNTRTAETILATCCDSLPFSHFWSVLLLLGTAGEYCLCGCSNAVFPCSFHCHLPSLAIVVITVYFCFNQFPLPSLLSPPILFDPLSSLPHSFSIHVLSLPSPPPLPFCPFSPGHVPDPEVPCSAGCPNLHCWEQVAEEDCSG